MRQAGAVATAASGPMSGGAEPDHSGSASAHVMPCYATVVAPRHLDAPIRERPAQLRQPVPRPVLGGASLPGRLHEAARVPLIDELSDQHVRHVSGFRELLLLSYPPWPPLRVLWLSLGYGTPAYFRSPGAVQGAPIGPRGWYAQRGSAMPDLPGTTSWPRRPIGQIPRNP